MYKRQEGKYIASTAPYGYERVRIKNDKGYTLQIIPEQAEIVRMIYKLYTKGERQSDGSYIRLGMSLIAKKLDSLHIPPQNSSTWSRSSIKDMLSNPTYIGKVRWQWRKVVKSVENGTLSQKRHKDKDYILCEGRHEAIIDLDTFNKAQVIMSSHICPPVSKEHNLKNPLSGIVVCGLCGHTMTRAKSNTRKGYDVLMCPNRYCPNISAPLYLIEEKILDGLGEWLRNYRLDWDTKLPASVSETFQIKENAIAQCKKNLAGLQKQLENTFEFLEKGIYTTDMFLQRNKVLTAQIDALSSDIQSQEAELELERTREKEMKNVIPNIENILELYRTIDNIALKNELLKSVLDKVMYTKKTPNKKGNLNNANFDLVLYPKLPQS